MKNLFLAIAAMLGICSGASAAPAATTVKHPQWSRDAVIYEVNVRQYTPEGTFKAFEKHLPRLRELGVDILWFMPIHPISKLNRKGDLGSYYAVADYKGVNPEFGNMKDFKNLVKAAHEQGMKVIIDWVPNHTGCDNPWVKDHPDYYALNDQGKMFGPYDWTDVYKLNYANPATRAAMIDAMQYWLREADIDGFRCDVAGQVPVDFWNECRPALESVKSDIFMLAEATEPELMEHAFDMDYNWPMKDLFNAIAATSGQYTYIGPDQKESRRFDAAVARDIDTLQKEQLAEYPADSYMMNMVTNHDLNSWEGTEYERYGILMPAFTVLSYTLPGMPLIYTGQETAMNRAFEFFKKDTPPQWEPRHGIFDFLKTLNALKHNRKELAAGRDAKYERVPTTSPDVLVFKRTLGDATTLVGVNLGSHEAPVKFVRTVPDVTDAVNVFGGSTTLPTTLQPGEYFVFTVN